MCFEAEVHATAEREMRRRVAPRGVTHDIEALWILENKEYLASQAG